ncbi:MAG: hypothetical protein HFJ59_07750 [Clostridia bacterium]|nr:hypothetical protein [Clostridia bacterium]
MQTHEIPRNYKGEGRILYIFSTKGLIYTAVGTGFGLIFYFIFKTLGFSMIGIISTLICGAIGYAVGTLKVPENSSLEISKKAGGESIDDVIKRWIKFKKNGNRVYIYKIEEDTKDE